MRRVNDSPLPLDTESRIRWNLPNGLSLLRIVGSALMLCVGLYGNLTGFVTIYIVLGITDLIDGPIARRLKQDSKEGARLDSVADILLSGSLLVGTCYLKWEALQEEGLWIVLAVVSYGLVVTVSLGKFGRLPATHTIAAKINHFLVAVAGVCLLLDISVLPLRLACVTTLITNLESSIILLKMKMWQTDVRSVFHLKLFEPGHRAPE